MNEWQDAKIFFKQKIFSELYEAMKNLENDNLIAVKKHSQMILSLLQNINEPEEKVKV
jgi:hypothetical protein